MLETAGYGCPGQLSTINRIRDPVRLSSGGRSPISGRSTDLDRGGDSYYHGLQIQAEKRYSNGLQFIAGYTFARCISHK